MQQLKPFFLGLAVGFLLLVAWLYGSRNAARKALKMRRDQVDLQIMNLEDKIHNTYYDRLISPETASKRLYEYNKKIKEKQETFDNILTIDDDDENILDNLTSIFSPK